MQGTNPNAPSRWPHRLALATVAAAVPLIGFGGQVTTLEAGLAIDGWWVLEPGRGDHFLWFYPLDKWFRDLGTFTEHTHRLFGTLVGLLSIATLLATLRCGASRAARWLALTGLLAVSLQGTIGGLRVLERSDDLAFLHGVLGQGVFALLAAVAVVTAPRWASQRGAVCKLGPGLRRAGPVALATLYLTIALGAWLRHQPGFLLLIAHIVGVFASGAALLVLGRRLLAAAAAQGDGPDRSMLRVGGLRLLALLALQVLLGVLAFAVVYLVKSEPGANLHHTLFPTLHVLVGALLLAQVTAALLWSRRVLPESGATTRAAGAAALGVHP